MAGWQNIWNSFHGATSATDYQKMAVATVVKVEGSAYRRPGARMIVVAGESPKIVAGSVSGGCLEKDVLLRSRRVVERGEPELVRYDSTKDGDEFLGLGLGCKGVIDILIEPAKRFVEWELPRAMGAMRRRCTAVIVHVIGGGAVPLGTYQFLDSTGEGAVAQSIAGAPNFLNALFTERARATLGKAQSCWETVPTPSGNVDCYFEFVKPRIALTVFGVGPDVWPMADLANLVGFDVRWVDCAGVRQRPERLAGAENYLSLPLDQVLAELTWQNGDFAILMTHHYPSDLTLLRYLLDRPLKYIGVLGSRTRIGKLRADLRAAGISDGDERWNVVHAPVGLDLGAEGPQEIALAVSSEILAVARGRTGGSLRQRGGGIAEDAR